MNNRRTAILGAVLMMFSATMLPPIIVSLIIRRSWLAVSLRLALTSGSGFFVWLPVRRREEGPDAARRFPDRGARSGWCLGVSARHRCSSPKSHDVIDRRGVRIHVRSDDTGATVITGLDALPRSILYYRQQLQWLGGMGIIVLAVAVLPMLGVGGMQLYRAETPGPIKDTKLTPRITETAKALWYVYLGIHRCVRRCYWLAGMDRIRCDVSQLQHRGHRWFFHARSQHRHFQSHRSTRCRRVHVSRRHKFLIAFFRLAQQQFSPLPARPGISRLYLSFWAADDRRWRVL